MCGVDITHVNIDDSEIFLPPEEVMIGFATRSLIAKSELPTTERNKSAKHRQHFMIPAHMYGTSRLPLTDPVLLHAHVLQFEQHNSADFNSVLFFIDRFPTLQKKLKDSMDKLYDQFTDYQSLDQALMEGHGRIDNMLHLLGNLQGCDGPRFNLMFEVASHILLLPHSNPGEERVFTTVAKNKTKFRLNLSNKLSLPSILTCKTNCFNHFKCFEFQPTKSTLEKVKKASSQHNAYHS